MSKNVSTPQLLLGSLLLSCAAMAGCAPELQMPVEDVNDKADDKKEVEPEGDPQFLNAVSEARAVLKDNGLHDELRLVQFYWGTVSDSSYEEVESIPKTMTFFDPDADNCYVFVTGKLVEHAPVAMSTWSTDYYDCSADLTEIASPKCTQPVHENGNYIGFEGGYWGRHTGDGAVKDCEPGTIGFAPHDTQMTKDEIPTTIGGRSGCNKIRQSRKHPWAQTGWEKDHAATLNRRLDGDTLYSNSGLIWWDRSC